MTFLKPLSFRSSLCTGLLQQVSRSIYRSGIKKYSLTARLNHSLTANDAGSTDLVLSVNALKLTSSPRFLSTVTTCILLLHRLSDFLSNTRSSRFLYSESYRATRLQYSRLNAKDSGSCQITAAKTLVTRQ